VIVSVPASSANLGPGFDTLGMALTLRAELGLVDLDEPVAGARLLDEHHPATIAFRRSGGQGGIWGRCPIPSGRGLGFSGAVRVGGAVLAHVQRGGPDAQGWRTRIGEVLALTSELEGHADNVAASLFGGVVVAAADRVVRVPLAIDPAIVVWVPARDATATDESRRALGAPVPFVDAVFNVARSSMFVAALAAGDVEALRSACEDRLHQPARLARAAPSRRALETALGAGAWAAWLSGSGPTVAAMCAPEAAGALITALAAELSSEGHTKVLQIDHRGAVAEPT